MLTCPLMLDCIINDPANEMSLCAWATPTLTSREVLAKLYIAASGLVIETV